MTMSRRTWLAVSGVSAILLPTLGVLLANVWITCAAKPRVKPMWDLPHCPVAIVLGAKVYPDRSPSAMLADRLETGVQLYRAGIVEKLLLSGDHGQRRYDEVNAMRLYVLAAGIPKEDVFLDHAGFSTYETMYRARDVFQVRQAILVTQRFHLARAVYTARQMGLDAWGFEADRRSYATAARNEAREVLARVKALIQLHLWKPRPRCLGPAIPVTGDGRCTWDEVE